MDAAPALKQCEDELGDPLKAADLVAAFRAEGFTMKSLAASDYCGPVDAADTPPAYRTVADVSNDDPATNLDDDVRDAEGWATCSVFRGPVRETQLEADLDASADSPIFSGRKAEFRLANVDCRLYPASGEEEAQIRRAHAAMKRLVGLRAGGS